MGLLLPSQFALATRTRSFVERLKVHLHEALAQTLVKITAPGVPDFSQGTALWELSLVDPNNRRPVDWGLGARLLDELRTAMAAAGDRAALAHELVKSKEDARVKLFLIHEGLAFRGARRAHARCAATGRA